MKNGYNEPMDKTLRRFSSLDEMKAEQRRLWEAVPSQERFDAITEAMAEAFAFKTGEDPYAREFCRTLTRVERPQR